MRRFLFLLFLTAIGFNLAAQTNFYKMSAGAGFGPTITYSDAAEQRIGYAGNMVYEYYFTPYMNLGFEAQHGKLKGGEVGNGLFVNDFTTIAFNGKIQMGQFLGENALNTFVLSKFRGLYIGSGIGAIQNRVLLGTAKKNKRKGKEIFVPINAGINFNLQRKWHEYAKYVLNFNYQMAMSFEDGMDGKSVLGSKNDAFGFFSIGVRYNFGNIGLDQSRRRL